MGHKYLIDTYQFIDERVAAAEKVMESSAENLGTKSFAEGRLTMLREIQGYLSDQYTRKLPKRLRGRYQKH